MYNLPEKKELGELVNKYKEKHDTELKDLEGKTNYYYKRKKPPLPLIPALSAYLVLHNLPSPRLWRLSRLFRTQEYNENDSPVGNYKNPFELVLFWYSPSFTEFSRNIYGNHQYIPRGFAQGVYHCMSLILYLVNQSEIQNIYLTGVEKQLYLLSISISVMLKLYNWLQDNFKVQY